MAKLRVLVADDHQLLRAVIIALLTSEFQVVGHVDDGEQLISAALLLKPDVIVSDIQMRLIDGVSAREDLRSRGVDARFVFTTAIDIGELSSFVEDGPVAFVHKTDLVPELELAVWTVADGRSYLSQSLRST